MAVRDDMYQQFGPLLLEGLIDNLLEEINFLRTNAGMPLIQKEAFLGTTNNHLGHLPQYDWMNQEP